MLNSHYRCVGVGCGPSNLSIAALLHGQSAVTNIFFDMKPEFSWHEGMMLPDTSLQVSMFKDLVTLADPTSRFSYVSYLHQHGRLLPFLNARFEQIPRLEFADYLKWVASANENIHFGEKVEQVDFNGSHFVVETSRRRVTSENIVVGVGISPLVPSFARANLNADSHFHIHEFAKRPQRFGGRRVLVVGGGQSGAEAVLDLLRRTGQEEPSEVIWLSRRENFYPIDDSPFANDLFTPTHSNYFYDQSPEFRQDFLKRNVLASDGISEHTLREIYQRIYVMRYIEHSPMRVRLMPFRDAQAVMRAGDAWVLKSQHLGNHAIEEFSADVVVWATGFRSTDYSFMRPLQAKFEREEGEIRIDRDYAAVWDGPSDRNIFMLNASRRQRGLPEPNLSLTAWRSQIVIDKMLGRPRRPESSDDAFVNWAASSFAEESVPV
ncbi:MAG: lysine N(6)-hydroxylase/L-ornithine N(5)-oxygenase family protein [Aeromonas popoffii]|uniref:lysine N(6)-hydroxylase/L-ornithine N(5)-oxygenase family protein n=1 Tax=Aeromonas popoffii TaxID=70856 RepID=UPI003F311629